MANVLGELFGNIAAAIREKTGDTATMKPAEFPDNIRAIETGGGSSDDVRYVTFMSYDGTEEHGRLPVAVGYDCPNPKFTVTRESTAQYDFVHDAWATEPNGTTDANALKAVTEDRTVYATFTAVLRYYTITYLDTDGSVLKTESLAYGSMPSYNPTPPVGYELDTWVPALAEVTGDATYTVAWKQLPSFATATWAEIAAAAADGTAPNKYAIGDKKTIVHTYADGTTEEVELEVLGFNINKAKKETDSNFRTTSMDIGLVGVLEKYGTFNPKTFNSTTSHGNVTFINSQYFKRIHEDIIPTMPEDLQNVLCVCQRKRYNTYTKTYGYISSSTTNGVTSYAKVWPFSVSELNATNHDEGAAYTSYKNSAEKRQKGYAYWTSSITGATSNTSWYYVDISGVSAATDNTSMKLYFSYTFTL